MSMDETPGPRLDWFPITRYNKYAGELLAAFELLRVRAVLSVELNGEYYGFCVS